MSDGSRMQAFLETQGVSVALVAITVGIVVSVDLVVYLLAPPGERAAVLPWLIVTAVLVAAFIGGVRMHTRVDAEGLHIRTPWFVRTSFAFDAIASAEAVTYRQICDYQGWGIRFSRLGRACNLRGDRGVQLVIAGGKRF